jgi:hypothetical protein
MKRKNAKNEEEMTNDLMNELLKELGESVFWPAIQRYVQSRYVQIDNGLRTIDPFKNPTEMARTQGFFGGVSDLTKYVEELKAKAEAAAAPLPDLSE